MGKCYKHWHVGAGTFGLTTIYFSAQLKKKVVIKQPSNAKKEKSKAAASIRELKKELVNVQRLKFLIQRAREDAAATGRSFDEPDIPEYYAVSVSPLLLAMEVLENPIIVSEKQVEDACDNLLATIDWLIDRNLSHGDLHSVRTFTIEDRRT